MRGLEKEHFMRDVAELTGPDDSCFRARVQTAKGVIVVTPRDPEKKLRLPFSDIADIRRAADEEGADACFVYLKKGGTYQFCFKHPEESVPALLAEYAGLTPEEAEAQAHKAALRTNGKRCFGAAAVLLAAALLAGSAPIVIGQPFDGWRFGLLTALAAAVAVVGASQWLRGRETKSKAEYKDE